MFDLSIKDKPKTPFGKLKDKLKVKKLSQMESSSAIVPSNIGRLDSDDEDEKKPKSKAAAFFKGRLRKSSLTRSNTSLGSDSTISSTSATVPTSAGISIVLPDVIKKPAARNSSLSTEPTATDHEASPRMTHKRAFSDEVSQLKLFPEPKSVQNLKPKGSPISKSSVCINGSHVYTEVPAPKPTPSLEKASPASRSFQNIVKKGEEVTEVMRGPSHSSEKPEHKPLGPPVEETNTSWIQSPQPKPTMDPVRAETKPVQITSPMVFTEDLPKSKSLERKAKDEKPKAGHHQGTGKNEPAAEPKPLVPPSSEERGKVGSWFGSKDIKETQQKPSLDVSPWVETSSFASPHYTPCLFAFPQSLVDALPRTNLDRASPIGVFGTLSASNPFLNLLQNNPFFEDFLSDQLLNTSSPTHFFSSFPTGSNATSEAAERGSFLVEEHSPLASPHSEEVNVYSYKGGSSNMEVIGDHPESSSCRPRVISEWEEQFDAFASSRLQPSPSNYQKSPESEVPKVTRDCEKYFLPSPSSGMETVKDDMFISAQKEDAWHNLQPELSWPQNLNNYAKVSNEPSALPSRLPTNSSPECILNPAATGPSANTIMDQNMPNRPSPHSIHDSSESRIATVQPRLLMEQSMVGVRDVAMQNSPVLTEDNIAMASIGEHALMVSGIDVHNMQMSKQVSTQHNPERIQVVQEVNANEKVEEIIKEQTISLNVGSVAPPKPPRLILSTSFEQIETEDYNCKQTSHQDTTGKQMENPEEHLQEQNMGESKQTVSPVACCPVIEIRSPVLGALTEDTQSTTEGILTNLREENNDLGTLNGEHLLDVNEVTTAEQFRTCPSIVSLDADLSSLHEGSDKLELINCGPSKPLNATLGGIKHNHDDFISQKSMPLPKIQNIDRSELSSRSKKGDQSDFVFWTALEEQLPSHEIGLDTRQKESTSRCTSGLSDGGNVGSLNSAQRLDPEQGTNEDVVVLQEVESAGPLPYTLQDGKLQYEVKALTNDSPHGYSLSQQSSWSADIIVDFKTEDFWRAGSEQLRQSRVPSLPSPGNPFSPADRTPFFSHKNPFIVEHSQSSLSSESSLQEEASFKDLHARAALRNVPPAVLPTGVKAPYLHDNQPLAFSTPFLTTAPNPKASSFPSPIMLLTTPGATTTSNTHTATLSGLHSPMAGGMTTAAPQILPLETQTADHPFMPLKTSPHPVKPISANLSDANPERKTTQKPAITMALSSGLEMLKSVTGVPHSTPKKPDQERLKDLCLPDHAAKYYHLTHDELIHMLLQREAELSNKENHVRELEEYIDKLLVRIMDQAPALLQAPLETKQ
ncbi:hypothetical protein GDO81_018667 [Engystomops pustulosus]|uniref:FIP-RBD domain-containing protein n=1 Tax=Engystomops pustulosus TaxID=76066 RepID=A0AAV6ZAL9_ENGPU|nr:hypothetical protein GDO81_018667 [Engystomops pustulosus]